MTGKIVYSRLLSKSIGKRTSPLFPQSAVRIKHNRSAIIHKNNLWKEKRLTLDYHCFSSCTCAKAAWWWTPLLYMPRWHFFLINVKGHLHAHTTEKEIYHLLSSPMEEPYSVILNYYNTTSDCFRCHASKNTGGPRSWNDDCGRSTEWVAHQWNRKLISK